MCAALKMSRRKQYRPVRVQEEDDKINDNIKSGGAITTRISSAANNATTIEIAAQIATEDEKGASSSSSVVKSIETTKIAATTKTIAVPNVLQTSHNNATKTLKKLIENKFVNENDLLLASQFTHVNRQKHLELSRDQGGDELNGELR